MRNIIFVLLLLLSVLFTSCKKMNSIDTKPVDQFLQITDSLNNLLTDEYNYTLTKIYSLTEDSVLADSISKIVVLPDTLVFYEYLKINIKELDDIFYLSQQEIFSAEDQLNGLKEDVKTRQISNVQFELQFESHKKMVDLVKELVDSNILVIEEIAGKLYINSRDSI